MNERPPDADDRERAVTTFDRNVVVTAGAGTGKTTLLVDRLVHFLMREPHPLRITDIVALTFTNKAAHELKLRLRERLESLGHADAQTDTSARMAMAPFQERYHLTADRIRSRAEDALRHLSRCEIGTLHSFAATLLRLYPLEAGCDPQFQEDDGRAFERHFDQMWKRWIEVELSTSDPVGGNAWKSLLRQVSLDDLRDFAWGFREATLPIQQVRDPRIQAWLIGLESAARALLSTHSEQRHNEQLVQAAHQVIKAVHERGQIASDDFGEARADLIGKEVTPRKSWTGEALEQAERLVRIAQRLLNVDPTRLTQVCERLGPFLADCRDRFVKSGFISFDGLLVRARNLLRDFPEIREALKTKFQAILIDELQDTDPIQYEILFFLAETLGQRAARWDGVQLTPGKLFVVGDPKQSIYAFRGADIEAYLRVIETIERQGGIHCALTTSFRCGPEILDVVNGIFHLLIRPDGGFQPSYIAIHASGVDGAASAALHGVALLCTKGGSGNAEAARQREGRALADWLSNIIGGKVSLPDRRGVSTPVRPGDVAILMRTLTSLHDYLEPLRLRKIPFVVEGAKHFYGTQEIVDVVNLMRAIASPADRSALVGLLRSAIGGLCDAEIYALHRNGWLNYQASLPSSDVGDRVRPLYSALQRLHTLTGLLPVSDVVERIFEEIPILWTACAFQGEQAVANLQTMRRTLLDMGQSDPFGVVVSRLRQYLAESREEAEGALVEEGADAVRILSVHKAKGLEFPIVILAGAHLRGNAREDNRMLSDWSSGQMGLRVGETWSLSAVFLAERARRRAEEEQKRLFYVAMTRARRYLVISYAETAQKVPEGSFLGLLNQTIQSATDTEMRVGEADKAASIRRTSLEVPPMLGPEEHNTPSMEREADTYVHRWEMRRQRYLDAQPAPLVLTPTRIRAAGRTGLDGGRMDLDGAGLRRDDAMRLGQLAHRFLQGWDDAGSPVHLAGRLDAFFEKYLVEGAMRVELTEILRHFFQSSAYEELCGVHVLGREVPLLGLADDKMLPPHIVGVGGCATPGAFEGTRPPLMEGTIDLIYERAGLLYVADYKTDRSPGPLAHYAAQGWIYCEATERAMRRRVAGFNLIFLRQGSVVPVPIGPEDAPPRR